MGRECSSTSQLPANAKPVTDKINLNCGQFRLSNGNMPRNCTFGQLLQPTSNDTLDPILPNPMEEIGVSMDVLRCSLGDFFKSEFFYLRSRLTHRGRNVLRKNRVHAIRTVLSIFPARTATPL